MARITQDVLIVGGGIIAYSIAMQLAQQYPKLSIAVLEKEKQLGLHQTGRNSGVIHAGVYYEPGSLKAEFCRKGCEAIKQFCQENSIPYKEIGKLIVATNEVEKTRLARLAENCAKNNLTVELLRVEELQKAQPGLQGLGAIFVKESAIVDWQQVCNQYAKIFHQLGGHSFYQQTVNAINEKSSVVEISTQKGEKYEAGQVIVCAGLYADKMLKLSGLTPEFQIIPFRGEFYRLDDKYQNKFKHLIYPVPDPELPFLGVHITPHINGEISVGPNAVLALGRESYRWSNINLSETAETLIYPGFWKMLAKYPKSTLLELYSSLSKSRYLSLVQKYYPKLSLADLQYYPAGIRAQAVDRKGQLIKDFLFAQTDRILHVCNAPSPAATASLEIGAELLRQLTKNSTN